MLPNLLTLSRIFISPLIVLCFYINDSSARYFAVWMYAFACVTDFLDGYLARQWHQVSNFGKFCDPVADKILVSITLLMLAGKDVIVGIDLIAACIILGREVLVSGLRSYLGQIQKVLPVTRFSKVKTGTQMTAIALLLLYFASNNSFYYFCGTLSLWLAALFTAITGYRYLKKGFRYIEF